MNELCQHEQFSAVVRVGRLTETQGGPATAFVAEVNIERVQCKQPFHFVGPYRMGSSPSEPRLSADRTELRAPIAPGQGEMILHGSYELPGHEGSDQ